jgi:ABC-type antimicrobial peptide transport system permease subunit
VVHQLDPGQPIAEVRSLEDVVRSSIADRRLHASLVSSFAVLGFAVAITGLVAALSRAVISRRQELAVRCALGATPRDTVGLVMRSAAWLVLPGVAIGVVLAIAVARGLAAQFFGVSAYDPPTYLAVAAATSATALLAAIVPARRAASVDPAVLLRSN